MEKEKMQTISVRMDERELNNLSTLLKENRSEIVRTLIEEGRKALAVELYKNKKVSLGLAARIAGVSLSELFDILREFNVRLNLDLEDARLSLKYAREFM